MKIIYKYPLSGQHETRVETHKGAQVLKVALQNRQETVWMMVDLNRPKTTMRIMAAATGYAFTDEIDTWHYIDSVLSEHHTFVWHYFWKWLDE